MHHKQTASSSLQPPLGMKHQIGSNEMSDLPLRLKLRQGEQRVAELYSLRNESVCLKTKTHPQTLNRLIEKLGGVTIYIYIYVENSSEPGDSKHHSGGPL